MRKLKLFLSLVFRRGDGMWFTPALAWETACIMEGERRFWGKWPSSRKKLSKKELLYEVAISGVELDERIDYVTVQIDRWLWNEIQRYK